MKKQIFFDITYGVTFLAFGNGAPDIFSAIAAVGNAKNGDAGLAIGALFGKYLFGRQIFLISVGERNIILSAYTK